ncbi:MAG: AMP-binding protein, partial [Gemmatimonadetes bacterium]|nr:AMP-binding protein [Gemmatimonadota bacterium]
MHDLGTLLPHHARYGPDRLAVVLGETRLTFADLAARVNRLGNALADLGLGPGDKIATVLPNCLEQLDAYWVAAQTGVVVVPLSPMLRGSGLARLLEDSDAAAVITDQAFSPHLDGIRGELGGIGGDRLILTDAKRDGYLDYRELVDGASTEAALRPEITGDHPYNIIYSSGTTGLPKGIVHTHRIRIGYCTGFAAAYRFGSESVAAHAGSLVFNGAFLTLMPAMYLGVPYIVMPQFDPDELVALIERERVTH